LRAVSRRSPILEQHHKNVSDSNRGRGRVQNANRRRTCSCSGDYRVLDKLSIDNVDRSQWNHHQLVRARGTNLSQTLTTSRQRTFQCANKAILSSEAKGGVGNSYDLRHISDRRILHRAIDSERENSTLKPFNAAAKPKTAKTLNFLVRSSAPRGSSLRNLKDFAPHSRETVIARCFPSAAPRQAPPRPSFRQRAITAVCSESPYALATLRVDRCPILWLGARCKGIARFAALHLDTCSLRREEVVRISREEISRS
jgi:hypothetical protein